MRKALMGESENPELEDDKELFVAIEYARETLHEAFECVVRKRKGFMGRTEYEHLVDSLWDLCKKLDAVNALPAMLKKEQAD